MSNYKKNPFTFSIAKLLATDNSNKECHDIELGECFCEDELGFPLKAGITGTIELSRADEDILAELSGIETEGEFTCQRCLEKCVLPLEIKEKSYVFYKNKPKEFTPADEFYLINKKDLTIDLGTPIRQEIVLSVPLLMFCKSDCKGLCDKCGANLNKKDCSCAKHAPSKSNEKTKPLSNLKDLFLLAKKKRFD